MGRIWTRIMNALHGGDIEPTEVTSERQTLYLIGQEILEAEGRIDASRSSLACLLAKSLAASRDVAETEKQLALLIRDAESALSAGREDIARAIAAEIARLERSKADDARTSSPVLSSLANRDLQDLYRLLAHAGGHAFSHSVFAHDYSHAEIAELTEVLRRLSVVRDVLLKVNAAYIASAAKADEFRTEPPFRLQGSYRNMNKLAEKISAVMNDAEIDQLITDHYRSESQLLAGGSEENLLKLAEIRGALTPEQEARWGQIKKEFMRNKAMGGDEKQVGNRIVAQLNDAVLGIRAIAERPLRSL